jgi:two-component system, sensor histidine kinase and response regulator
MPRRPDDDRSDAAVARAEGVAPPAARPFRRRGVRALVVDDEPLARKVALVQLARLGLAADAAGSGDEAIEVLAAKRHNLLLIDGDMPGLDGWQTTARIRAAEPAGEHLPIIAVTSNDGPEHRRRSVAVGIDVHLVKPLSVEMLAAVLPELLGAPPGADPSGSSMPAGTLFAPLLSGPPAGDDPSRTLDASALDRLRELESITGELGLVDELVDGFVQRSTARLSGLRRAALDHDAAAVRGAAHWLRGSAGTVGAFRLAAVCRELEAAASSGDMGRAQELVARLEQEVFRAVRALAVLRSR